MQVFISCTRGCASAHSSELLTVGCEVCNKAYFPGDGPFSAHINFIWIQIETPEELVCLVLCTAQALDTCRLESGSLALCARGPAWALPAAGETHENRFGRSLGLAKSLLRPRAPPALRPQGLALGSS